MAVIELVNRDINAKKIDIKKTPEVSSKEPPKDKPKNLKEKSKQKK